jgi:F-type H+-transporting ATPase subunit epsilon
MNTFRLIVSSPDGNLFDGQAYMLVVRGTAGELAVMAGHIPFVTTVKPCDIKIEPADEEADTRIGRISGGLLTVGHDAVTLLTGHVAWQE